MLHFPALSLHLCIQVRHELHVCTWAGACAHANDEGGVMSASWALRECDTWHPSSPIFINTLLQFINSFKWHPCDRQGAKRQCIRLATYCTRLATYRNRLVTRPTLSSRQILCPRTFACRHTRSISAAYTCMYILCCSQRPPDSWPTCPPPPCPFPAPSNRI